MIAALGCGPTVGVGDGSADGSESEATTGVEATSVASESSTAVADTSGEVPCEGVLACFGEAESVPLDVVPREILVGHIDASALPDLLVRTTFGVDGTSERLTIVDIGAPVPAFTTVLDDSGGPGALVDVDGDGLDEFVVVEDLELVTYTGGPALADTLWRLETEVYLGRPGARDRGDGTRELIVQVQSPGGFYRFDLPAPTMTTWTEQIELGSNEWGSFSSGGVALPDLDGDGVGDVVSYVVMVCDFSFASALDVRAGNGSVWPQIQLELDYAERVDFAGGDLDGVAGDELLLHDDSGAVRVLGVDGNVLVERAQLDLDDPIAVATGDLSGDGRADVVVVEGGVNTLHVYAEWNAPQPSVHDTRELPATPTALALTDVDGDGHVDIVVGLEDGTLAILRAPG